MREKLGQHFLTNEGVLKKIAEASGAKEGSIVVEIGPGHGELTRHLLGAVGKKGRVIALERDEVLASETAAEFKDLPQLELKIGNALETLPEVSSKLGEYILVGNIPYYLTGFLLRNIEELGNKPVRTVLTIQKEVAERIMAAPPDMNRLSASVLFWAEPEIIGFISRNDFSPPPEVDSATILLETRSGAKDDKAYYRALNTVFKQPRKTILNNLEEGLGLNKRELEIILEEIGINPALRPQNLEIGDIKALASRFF